MRVSHSRHFWEEKSFCLSRDRKTASWSYGLLSNWYIKNALSWLQVILILTSKFFQNAALRTLISKCRPSRVTIELIFPLYPTENNLGGTFNNLNFLHSNFCFSEEFHFLVGRSICIGCNVQEKTKESVFEKPFVREVNTQWWNWKICPARNFIKWFIFYGRNPVPRLTSPLGDSRARWWRKTSAQCRKMFQGITWR